MTRKSLETRLFILNMLPYVPEPVAQNGTDDWEDTRYDDSCFRRSG